MQEVASRGAAQTEGTHKIIDTYVFGARIQIREERPSPGAEAQLRQILDPISESLIFLNDKAWKAAWDARRGITDWTEEEFEAIRATQPKLYDNKPKKKKNNRKGVKGKPKGDGKQLPWNKKAPGRPPVLDARRAHTLTHPLYRSAADPAIKLEIASRKHILRKSVYAFVANSICFRVCDWLPLDCLSGTR